jgi:hypothetical protein
MVFRDESMFHATRFVPTGVAATRCEITFVGDVSVYSHLAPNEMAETEDLLIHRAHPEVEVFRMQHLISGDEGKSTRPLRYQHDTHANISQAPSPLSG